MLILSLPHYTDLERLCFVPQFTHLVSRGADSCYLVPVTTVKGHTPITFCLLKIWVLLLLINVISGVSVATSDVS